MKEQAEALARRGHQVAIVIVSYESFGSRVRSLFSGVKLKYDGASGITVLHVHVVLSWMNRFRRNPLDNQKHSILKEVTKQVQRHYGNRQPDLVHHHCLSDNAYIARELARVYSVPYFFTEHSPYSSDEELNKMNLFERKSDRQQFIAGAAACIAVSEVWSRAYQSIYGRTYQVIPNMVIDYFLQPSEVTKSAIFTFCCVAVFDKNKNQQLLIRAFAAAFAETKNVRLVLVGSGPMQSHCRNEAQMHGVADRVLFTGKLDRSHLRDILDESHVAMLVSNKETFGISLVEAMFRGLPIITTQSGGPEVFVTKSTGVLAPCGDVGALAAVMQDVHRNYSRYSAEELRRYATEHYAESAIMIQLEQLYAVYVNSR